MEINKDLMAASSTPIVLTILTGAITTWSALSTRPAQYLRALG